MSSQALLTQPFGTIGAMIRGHAARDPRHLALVHGERRISYGELDAWADRVGAALRRDGAQPRDAVAICGVNCIEYAVLFVGALRAGMVPALIPPSAGVDAITRMVADSGARLVFDEAALGPGAFERWVADAPAQRVEPEIAPDWAFNIIYSSGTTGTPKGIVQPHLMRWVHMQRGPAYGFDAHSITLIATPLYSNTTLVTFFPTLGVGGTIVLMGKFDVKAYLELAVRERVTHTMLVPVQYQRIMAAPEFASYDLSAFRMKFSTSAPFAAALKRDVLARWPGGLVEYFGMTEGGATCVLLAHERPDKLHTVGRPAPGVDLRLVDDAGREVARGEAGEIVGHSRAMMIGYHNRPEETAQAEWRDAEGRRYIRTGDVARIDEDGFVILIDRRKDMIISGGFNIYPSDLEAVLGGHPSIQEAAVVGVPSARWGETPVAFVALRAGASDSAESLLEWANARVGKTQRLAAVEILQALPRSAIGKVLKRELRERYAGKPGETRDGPYLSSGDGSDLPPR